MRHFVFCHGFGLDSNYWNKLAPYFINEKCTFLDLGYLGTPFIPSTLEGEQIIGVGHSLGLIKLMQIYNNFDYLIGLNSFVDFIGEDIKRRVALKIMKKALTKSVVSVLKMFYKMCGAKFTGKKELNTDIMLRDLELLNTPHELMQVPTLIIGSNDDIVVPRHIVEYNFLNRTNVTLEMISSSLHMLGYLNASYVYDRIMSFLDER